MNSFEGELICLDGLQRITALLNFLSGKLKVFNGNSINDFEDKAVFLRMLDVKININNLKTRKEILQWYIDHNSGGTIHSNEEIERVKILLEKESEK